MVRLLEKRDGEKEMEFVKLCEMFEDMEKVKLDRAKLFRMLEKKDLARSYMVIEERDGGTVYRDWETDRKSTRLNSSHITRSRMPSSA